MKKRIIIVAVVLILGAMGIYFFILHNKQSSEENTPTKTTVPIGETVTPNKTPDGTPTKTPASIPPPTTQQLYDVITQNDAVPIKENGQPDFGITNVKQPLSGWFIVTIRKNGLEPAKVILKQTGNSSSPLTVVAGPGTSFPPSDVSLPDAVRRAL
ncbi:MAG: hypothetical protein H6797_05950 [Candidatus Nomurabacteria bacterium]|nr:MAG: hypothetical protein H6797_05950 [Candidatus Nomurabacteria bacterium]